MTDTLRPPSLRVQVPRDDPCSAWSSSSTPTLRRRRLKMRRTKKATSERLENGSLRHSGSHLASKEYLQLPAIEITPSSDEDVPWSNCSTPSASPRRKRFLIRKWLKVREKKEPANESSSQPSSQQSSHDDDSSRFLTPFMRR
ncbi:protein Aster-B isoform X1 [Tachysurus ichikawai]